MHDTSHYAECLSFMNMQKSKHMKRFWFIAVLTIFNGYFHVITMSIWRAEDGVFPIAIFGFGFFWAVFAFFHNIAVIVLGLLANPERLVICWLAIAVVVMGLVLNLMNPLFGIPVLTLLIIGLMDCRKMAWVKQQPGYPYFNERFTEQGEKYLHDYDAQHEIDDRMRNDMMDVSESKDIIPTPEMAVMPDVDVLIPDITEPMRADESPAVQQPAPSPLPLPTPDAVEIQEVIKPVKKRRMTFKERMQAENDAPNADFDVPSADFDVPTDIPDPVWNIPDPVMDTTSILSSVPDIAGDIQDLPDIPDIPKI